MGEDRGQITVGEPAGVRARAQCALDLLFCSEVETGGWKG